jgi:hypothetical protein
MNVDKSLRSGALLMSVNSDEKLGFGIDENGKSFLLILKLSIIIYLEWRPFKI